MTTTDESRTLRIGTRGSPLAVRQAEWVAARLRERAPDVRIRIERIRTSGDRMAGRPLADVGGKGLFIKEIEEALLDGGVDVGVHSMKDLPAAIPDALRIAAVPVREDPRDVLVSAAASLRCLARGARVGTSSLRRRALLKEARPDLRVEALRGNVETRVARWRSGELDAIVVAAAGLRRLAIEIPEARPLACDAFLPAIGQGALALEVAPENRWWELVVSLDVAELAAAVAAERGVLVAVGGDCKTPIAAHATVSAGELHLRAMIADPEGRRVIRGERRGAAAAAAEIGLALGGALLDRGGRALLAALGRGDA